MSSFRIRSSRLRGGDTLRGTGVTPPTPTPGPVTPGTGIMLATNVPRIGVIQPRYAPPATSFTRPPVKVMLDTKRLPNVSVTAIMKGTPVATVAPSKTIPTIDLVTRTPNSVMGVTNTSKAITIDVKKTPNVKLTVETDAPDPAVVTANPPKSTTVAPNKR